MPPGEPGSTHALAPAAAWPRQEFEVALGSGKALSDLSDACIRAIRNHLPFDTPANGDGVSDAWKAT
jgi:hypothetical protein